LVGRRYPGCIAPQSCILAVDLPSVEVDSPEDFEVVNSLEILTILHLSTLNLQNPAFKLDVLRVSLACKVFLDHPQNYRVCWRGSRPSPVRVSDKQNIQKRKIKTNLRKLGLDRLD
jgi:hypothetical protein